MVAVGRKGQRVDDVLRADEIDARPAFRPAGFGGAAVPAGREHRLSFFVRAKAVKRSTILGKDQRRLAALPVPAAKLAVGVDAVDERIAGGRSESKDALVVAAERPREVPLREFAFPNLAIAGDGEDDVGIIAGGD